MLRSLSFFYLMSIPDSTIDLQGSVIFHYVMVLALGVGKKSLIKRKPAC